MFFQIILPSEPLRPYITRYVFVRAEGSTDTMAPPIDDPRFVNGKHVQPLLPNYGSFIFMRNVKADISGTRTDGLTLLGANQKTIGLTTLNGWFEGMLLDFEPGGMHALLHIDLQQLAGKVLTAQQSSDAGLLQLDAIFKSSSETERIASLIDAFFVGHLPHKEDINYTRLSKVIEACDEAKGNISAEEMASVACLSERQFLRVFKTYVGIPPKQFIRLRRFHRTIQQMQQTAHAGNPLDLLSIALTHGYYDLSHMALEFQQMGCVSPSHFRALGIPLSDDFSVFFA
ncbi:MAG: AraC family transcriptional regulator [Paludibacteraceae bacterium]|nr:AraC family transcriptional regulator [Paludibacteraceae bacterium]